MGDITAWVLTAVVTFGPQNSINPAWKQTAETRCMEMRSRLQTEINFSSNGKALKGVSIVCEEKPGEMSHDHP